MCMYTAISTILYSYSIAVYVAPNVKTIANGQLLISSGTGCWIFLEPEAEENKIYN